jgi:hypothetical protein
LCTRLKTFLQKASNQHNLLILAAVTSYNGILPLIKSP